MEDDLVGAAAVWFIGLLAISFLLPVAVALVAVVLVAKLLCSATTFGYGLVRGDEHERELRRVIRERNRAISDIVRLRVQGERQMNRIARRGCRLERRWR